MIDRIAIKAAEIDQMREALTIRARRLLEASANDARLASLALAALEWPGEATEALDLASKARRLAGRVLDKSTSQAPEEA